MVVTYNGFFDRTRREQLYSMVVQVSVLAMACCASTRVSITSGRWIDLS